MGGPLAESAVTEAAQEVPPRRRVGLRLQTERCRMCLPAPTAKRKAPAVLFAETGPSKIVSTSAMQANNAGRLPDRKH